MKIVKVIEYTLVFIIVVMVLHLPLVNKAILHSIDGNHFRYANNDASFTHEESFSFKEANINRRQVDYFIDQTNPAKAQRVIYRLYRINPLCIWRWGYYVFTSSQYPYRNWENIATSRRDFEENSTWQDF